MIFVFGSNLAGRHGAGAARFAVLEHGAVYGQGIGWQGNAYGIPTKDFQIDTLPLEIIQYHIDAFIGHALRHKCLQYKVTRIGCGLAGYTDEQIAPMFKEAPINCYFDEAWIPYLPGKAYWYDHPNPPQ
jgi:hypothetical protein